MAHFIKSTASIFLACLPVSALAQSFPWTTTVVPTSQQHSSEIEWNALKRAVKPTMDVSRWSVTVYPALQTETSKPFTQQLLDQHTDSDIRSALAIVSYQSNIKENLTWGVSFGAGTMQSAGFTNNTDNPTTLPWIATTGLQQALTSNLTASAHYGFFNKPDADFSHTVGFRLVWNFDQ